MLEGSFEGRKNKDDTKEGSAKMESDDKDTSGEAEWVTHDDGLTQCYEVKWYSGGEAKVKTYSGEGVMPDGHRP